MEYPYIKKMEEIIEWIKILKAKNAKLEEGEVGVLQSQLNKANEELKELEYYKYEHGRLYKYLMYEKVTVGMYRQLEKELDITTQRLGEANRKNRKLKEDNDDLSTRLDEQVSLGERAHEAIKKHMGRIAEYERLVSKFDNECRNIWCSYERLCGDCKVKEALRALTPDKEIK